MLPYLSLLSIQGLPDPSSLGLYITLNGRLCDVLTPLDHCSETEPVALSPKGDLALIIRSMGQGALVWVRVSVELIPVDQEVWLPLGREQQPLATLPQSASVPRLAITVGQTNRSRLRSCPYIGDSYSYEAKVQLQSYLVKDLAKEVYTLRHQVLALQDQETAWRQTIHTARNEAQISLSRCGQRETTLHEVLNALQREVQALKQTCMALEAEKRELESRLLASEAEKDRIKGECMLLKGAVDKAAAHEQDTDWVGLAVDEYFKGQRERLEREGRGFRWGKERVEVGFSEGLLVVRSQQGTYPMKEFVRSRKEGNSTELQIAPTFPVVRSLLSPIRSPGQPGPGSESPNSTFRTEINDIMQAIEAPGTQAETDRGVIAPRLKPLRLLSPLRSKLS